MPQRDGSNTFDTRVSDLAVPGTTESPQKCNPDTQRSKIALMATLRTATQAIADISAIKPTVCWLRPQHYLRLHRSFVIK